MVRRSLRQEHCSPFEGCDLVWLLDAQAAHRGDNPFIVWEPFEGKTQVWTYRRFAETSARLAGGMRARGISPGDHVIVHLDNCPEFLLAWAACARLGAVAVTTNTRSAEAELAYYAADARAVAAITQPKYAKLICETVLGARWVALTDTDAGTEPESIVPAGTLRLSSLLQADVISRDAIKTFAPLVVQYTSGTTSRPKGVVWTHANALWAARGSAFHEGLAPADIHLVYLPLFHMNAMSCSVLSTLWVGGMLVLQPRFSASRFWPVALKHSCTWASMIPFSIKALMQQEVPRHSFRFWGYGINAPTSDRHFNVKSIGWWGMTETVTVCIVGSTYLPNVPLTLGRPSPLYEIAVLDDNGSPASLGQTGDLRVRGIPGLSLFREYLHQEEATETSFDQDGFFITGDRVTLQESGSITFSDRAKDMLKVGGENVAASEIERVVSGAGKIAEVAVVAARDSMLDEVPVAFVILEAGADVLEARQRIEARCLQQLADFKRPREIRFVDDFPRATLNKVAKAELRSLLQKERDHAFPNSSDSATPPAR